MKQSVEFLNYLDSIVRRKSNEKPEPLNQPVSKGSINRTMRRKRRQANRKRKKEIRRLKAKVEEIKDDFNKCGFRSDTVVMSYLLLSYTSKENWPSVHAISKAVSSEISVDEIFKEMMEINVGVDLMTHDKWKRLNLLRVILTKLVKRHHQAPYKYMAWHYSLIGMSCKGANSSRTSKKGNFDKAVNPGQVLKFLSACISHTVPKEFFGSSQNLKIFLHRWLSVLVGVAGRKSVGLGHLMQGVQVTQVLWTKEASEIGGRGPRACALTKAWLWVLLNYVNIILSCHFVCVRSSGERCGGRPYAFYPKRTWQSIKDATIRLHTKNESDMTTDRRVIYKGWTIMQISSDEKEEFIKSTAYPLISHLQLRPKKNGVRPVLRVRFSENVGLKVKACVALVKYLNSYIKKRCPSQNTLQDIFQAWENMYQIKKIEQPMGENNRKKGEPVFQAVTVDIEDAFGCVIQDKLCEIIEKKLKAMGLTSDYCVGLSTITNNVKTRGGRNYYKHSYVLCGLPSQNPEVDTRGKKVTYTKSQLMPFMVGELHEFIINCIKCQIIKEGKRYYRLIQGLAQGSVLSPPLWDLYCRALEEEHLIPHLSIGEETNDFSYLIRGMDDCLFLTENADEAKWFLTKMIDGFPDYNIYIKRSKLCTTLSSFEAVNVKKDKHGVFDAVRVRFWGLLLNPKELSIMADCGGPPGRDLTHVMNLCIEKKPLRVLEEACHIRHLKISPLLLNAKYNEYKGVLCNIYRAALIQVARIHAAVRLTLQPRGEKSQNEMKRQEVKSPNSESTFSDSSGVEQNLIQTIDNSNLHKKNKSFMKKGSVPNQVLLSRFLYDQAKALASMIHVIEKRHNLPKIPTFYEIVWLAYKAYKMVLVRDGSRYPGVLQGLKHLEKCISKNIPNERTIILKEVLEFCKKMDS